ncbi:MFS transporter [Luedemannella helvata]|uniref:MFS transporter n=1 Tax=Luedemannella helvata TaxID=349315 RepID=A0ABP4XAN6_9ACTN
MARWLGSVGGGLPATFWYLWVGILVNRIGGFAVLFLSLYLTNARHLSVSAAGLVVGAFGAGGVAGNLLGGVLADRWGRRPTLLLAYFGSATALFALGQLTQVALIAAVCVVAGVCHAMAWPAMISAIVDVVPAAARTRALNLQFWAHNAGVAAASLLAGALASVSFSLMFALDAATTLAAAVVLMLKVSETRPAPAPPDRVAGPPAAASRRPAGGLFAVLRDRVFLAFVGLTFLCAVVSTQGTTLLPLAMRADGLTPAQYGHVGALSAALIVIGQLFVPAVLRHASRSAALGGAALLAGAAYGSLAFVDAYPAYLAAAIGWTLGGMLSAPPNAVLQAGLAPAPLRARYQAVFYLAFPAGGLVAPAIGGFSLEHLGRWHWLASAAIGLVAAGLYLRGGPAWENRMARLAAPPPRALVHAGDAA